MFSSGILNMGMVDAELDFLHKSVAFEKPVECDGRLRATALVLPLGLALCVRSGANYRLLYCTWVCLVCLRFFPPSTWLGLAWLTLAIFFLSALDAQLALLPDFPSIMKTSFN